MNIKEVAKKYGISADTIRYYERIGVLPPITRDEKGYRSFTEKDLNWVYFVKVLRQAGVSIEGLADYTKLSAKGGATLEARREILVDHLEGIEKEIADLKEARDYLKYKVDSFYGHIAEYEKNKLNINQSSENSKKG